jgi:hypothetical protein
MTIPLGDMKEVVVVAVIVVATVPIDNNRGVPINNNHGTRLISST